MTKIYSSKRSCWSFVQRNC